MLVSLSDYYALCDDVYINRSTKERKNILVSLHFCKKLVSELEKV